MQELLKLKFQFLHQFVGYDLYELHVRELQSYQNRLIELFRLQQGSFQLLRILHLQLLLNLFSKLSCFCNFSD